MKNQEIILESPQNETRSEKYQKAVAAWHREKEQGQEEQLRRAAEIFSCDIDF